MLRNKKKLDESELEDTEVAEESTPGGIEVPKEEGQKEAVEPGTFEIPDKETEERDESVKPAQTDPNSFTAIITLESELIESSSLQEIITVLDSKIQAIREAAFKKIGEIKN